MWLHPKRVPLLGSRYVKGKEFHNFEYTWVGNCYSNLGIKKYPRDDSFKNTKGLFKFKVKKRVYYQIYFHYKQ